ncbi:MAG: hypothetical protein ACREDR_13960, partial [Blastocatellia bacterium]
MRLLRTIVFLTITLMLLLFVRTDQAQQQYPPVWTDIMNLTGYSNMASGNSYSLGNGTQCNVFNTDIGGVQSLSCTPSPNTLV